MNYKILRKVNPEAARLAVLQYLSSNGGNISDCARVFGIQRLTIYDILKKDRSKSLKDHSKAPKTVANKTPTEIFGKVLKAAAETGYGPKRLATYLEINYKIKIPFGTLRGILRRNARFS